MAAEAEKAALEAAAAAITMNTTRGATTTTTMPSRVGVFNCFPALWHSLPSINQPCSSQFLRANFLFVSRTDTLSRRRDKEGGGPIHFFALDIWRQKWIQWDVEKLLSLRS